MENKFIKCGLIGWTMELFATSLSNYHRSGDRRMMGNTSLWMFPIYGMAAAMAPVGKFLCKRNIVFRGSVYMCMIFAAEYTTGWLLRRLGMCPWDYSESPLNIDGLIRLDYAPAWFTAGLLFENNVCGEVRKAYKKERKQAAAASGCCETRN